MKDEREDKGSKRSVGADPRVRPCWGTGDCWNQKVTTVKGVEGDDKRMKAEG